MEERDFETILFHQKDEVVWITLNRPEVHNAFNADMISELNEVFSEIKADDAVRVVVLTGSGKSFCAGADLNWMREIIDYSYQQNLGESLHLAELHQNIYQLPKPTVAMVNGTAIGGGTGLLSACDIAISAAEAVFSLSEVKLGLVPAAISPYVVRRIGESRAREYCLTGERITAARACEIGLVNKVVPLDELEGKVNEIVDQLLAAGPEALAKCKELLFNVPRMSLEEAKEYTARMIANLRISQEGQEGMAAFFEKRQPKWVKNHDKDTKDSKEEE